MEATKRASLLRQSDLIPEKILDTRVTIIGAGAVGSFVALALAKMGFSDITIFDGDTVGIENINCQFFPLGSVGEGKAEVIGQLIKLFSTTDANIISEAYVGPRTEGKSYGPFPGIVISCVDSMAARRLIWENHKGQMGTLWFIDPRMGGEFATMYTINPNSEADQKTYEKALFSDGDATPERCTARATIYTVLLLAGEVCKAVKDTLSGDPYVRTMTYNIKANAKDVWQGGTSGVAIAEK